MNKCYCSKPLGYTCHVCRKPEPWEDNKGIVTFIDWYFGKREQWSIHDFTRANLMGNKILDLLADQNTANAERIRGLERCGPPTFIDDEDDKLAWNEALEAAARLIEEPLTGKE